MPVHHSLIYPDAPRGIRIELLGLAHGCDMSAAAFAAVGIGRILSLRLALPGRQAVTACNKRR